VPSFSRMRTVVFAALAALVACASVASVADAYSKDQRVTRSYAKSTCKHRNRNNTCVLSSSTPCAHFRKGKVRTTGGWVRARCNAYVRDTPSSGLTTVGMEFYYR
jgi:hypothetical protein